MSYSHVPAFHFVKDGKRKPRRLYERTSFVGALPHGYSLSLAQTPTLAPVQKNNRWLLILLLLLVIAAVFYLSKKKAPAIKSIKKASTAELAKNLYKRLEARPRRNPSTMSALAAYSKK